MPSQHQAHDLLSSSWGSWTLRPESQSSSSFLFTVFIHSHSPSSGIQTLMEFFSCVSLRPWFSPGSYFFYFFLSFVLLTFFSLPQLMYSPLFLRKVLDLSLFLLSEGTHGVNLDCRKWYSKVPLADNFCCPVQISHTPIHGGWLVVQQPSPSLTDFP
jgi:hypothetical protein